MIGTPRDNCEDHFGGERLRRHLSVADRQIFLRELADLLARTGGKPGLSVLHALNWMSMHLYLNDLWSRL
jgi:hypothetical protein